VKDVLVIGEALVDIVSGPGQPPVEHPGGSPANVALGLARLDHETRLLTRIGDDSRGQVVLRHLRASGVQLEPGSITESPTSTAAAILDRAGLATYEFDLEWTLPPDASIGDAKAVHTGSIAATLAPGGDEVVRLVQSAAGRAVVSYDPNARPNLMGTPEEALARMTEIVAVADVVKVSDEDLAWLAPGVDPIEVAQDWRSKGPSIVVVTRGLHGATGVVSRGAVNVPAPKIAVSDTVGAGDALMAGLLDALANADLLTVNTLPDLGRADPDDLAPLLFSAVAVAAMTCMRPGADPPTRAELNSWLGAH
jgi:fructokinase